MKKLLLAITFILSVSSIVFASEGLVVLKSENSVSVTADKLIKLLEKKGMTIFARIDHAAGAQKVGKNLRPTQVVIFGNAKVGTPLMKCSQNIAIDLPQKALIMKNSKGVVSLSYNDPFYLAKRHNIKACQKVLKKVSSVLYKFSKVATSK